MVKPMAAGALQAPAAQRRVNRRSTSPQRAVPVQVQEVLPVRGIVFTLHVFTTGLHALQLTVL